MTLQSAKCKVQSFLGILLFTFYFLLVPSPVLAQTDCSSSTQDGCISCTQNPASCGWIFDSSTCVHTDYGTCPGGVSRWAYTDTQCGAPISCGGGSSSPTPQPTSQPTSTPAPTTAASSGSSSACPTAGAGTKTTCGVLTFDTCVDDKGQSVITGCSSGAQSFRCYYSNNSACMSGSSASDFNYQCSACGSVGGPAGGGATPAPSQPAGGGPALGSSCNYKFLDSGLNEVQQPLQSGQPYTLRVTMTNPADSIVPWNPNYSLKASSDTVTDFGLSRNTFKISDAESKHKTDVSKGNSVSWDLPVHAKQVTQTTSLSFHLQMANDSGQDFGAACEPQDVQVRLPNVFTKCYAISEDEATINGINDCSDSRAVSYSAHPLKVPFTLSSNSGVKRVFVKFFPTSGSPQTFQKNITFLPNPTLTSVECLQSATGQGSVINIKGQDFGGHAQQGVGGVKVKGAGTTITSWDGVAGAITATVEDRLAGENEIEVTRDDGQSGKGKCTVGVSSVQITAKIQCRKEGEGSAEGVSVKIWENSPEADPKKPLIDQKASLDKDGMVQGLTLSVQKGKKYVAVVKAPGTLARKKEFEAQGGTTIVDTITLPVGDIAPVGGDGKINAFDKSELIREWNALTSTTAKKGDFNQDGNVNVPDWWCMRQNINQEDDVFTPPVVVSPLPSVSPTTTVAPTLVVTPIPTETPTPTPTVPETPTPSPTGASL